MAQVIQLPAAKNWKMQLLRNTNISGKNRAFCYCPKTHGSRHSLPFAFFGSYEGDDGKEVGYDPVNIERAVF